MTVWVVVLNLSIGVKSSHGYVLVLQVYRGLIESAGVLFSCLTDFKVKLCLSFTAEVNSKPDEVLLE